MPKNITELFSNVNAVLEPRSNTGSVTLAPDASNVASTPENTLSILPIGEPELIDFIGGFNVQPLSVGGLSLAPLPGQETVIGSNKRLANPNRDTSVVRIIE